MPIGINVQSLDITFMLFDVPFNSPHVHPKLTKSDYFIFHFSRTHYYGIVPQTRYLNIFLGQSFIMVLKCMLRLQQKSILMKLMLVAQSARFI
jgi:hypothetical protein